ncbi:hypothetical protein ABE021_00895 [Sporosarcina gallistercoris]|uniref:hypothetical protein n=1 Tax=Sporosarcina gallistercoris TaxID=2762245 RepID=UPI003D2CB0A0
MATKSKNNGAMLWSIISIVIGLGTIVYCFPHITDLASDGISRTTRTVTYFIQIIKGGTV